MNNRNKICVIGAGAWGTTLAMLLAEKGHQVTLWAYEIELAAAMAEQRENKLFLPGFPLPDQLEVTGRPEPAAAAALLLFAVPTQHLRSVAKLFKEHLSDGAAALCASKGIELDTLKLPLQILGEELKTERLAALSGPNLSAEIARGLPAVSVIAAHDGDLAAELQTCLMLDRFRIYTCGDPLGVQLGGALKNVVAIAAGVADGLGLGNNAKAALLIRGIAEITRLGVALGAEPRTFAGLSGMGDLITTCASRLSRNHSVGEQLARGKKLHEILKGMKEVAEGVPTARAALALGKKHRVELPLTAEVEQVLYHGKDPRRSLNDLMTRPAASE